MSQDVIVRKSADHEAYANFILGNETGDVMMFRVRDGRPRLTIDYKLPKDTDMSKITFMDKQLIAPFNHSDISSFVSGILLILDDKTDRLNSISVECLYNYDSKGNKVEEKIVKAKVTFCKEDGVYKLKFINNFLDNKETVIDVLPAWHRFFINNVPMSKALISEIYSKKFFKNLDRLLERLAEENKREYKTEEVIINTSKATVDNSTSK